MIGQLPTSLDMGGAGYSIETDYRSILVFLAACSDPELSPTEKLETLIKRLYQDGFSQIPQERLEEVILQAKRFMDCGQEDGDKKPARKVMDWEQDKPILFPAIDKVAGMETRTAQYVHWWTLSGYFMEIKGGTFSTILGICRKKAKGRELKKREQEFYRSNHRLRDARKRYAEEEQAEIDCWNNLLDQGAVWTSYFYACTGGDGMAADGSLEFGTEVSAEGFKKGISILLKAMDGLTGAVNRLSFSILSRFNGVGQAITKTAQSAGEASDTVESIGKSVDGSLEGVEHLQEQIGTVCVQAMEVVDTEPVEAMTVSTNPESLSYDPKAMAAVFGEEAAEVYNYAGAVEQYGEQEAAALNKIDLEAQELK